MIGQPYTIKVYSGSVLMNQFTGIAQFNQEFDSCDVNAHDFEFTY